MLTKALAVVGAKAGAVGAAVIAAIVLAALLIMVIISIAGAAFQSSTTVWPVSVKTDTTGNYQASGWTISYLLAAGGVVLLAGASQLWHFWVAAALLPIARAAGISVASAFVTDLLPRAALGRGLVLVNTISWVAAFVGFAGSGYVLEQLGAPALFGIAAGLACSAALVLGLLPSMRRAGQPAAPQLEQSSLSGSNP